MGGLLLSTLAQAGGYQVSLQDQRQIGMGHTGTAMPFGGGTVFFNPGAMSHLDRNDISVGVSLINSRVAFRGTETSTRTARTDNPVGTPFYLYGVYGAPESKLKFGLGVYTPFGSSVQWEEGWTGRYALDQISLQAIFIQPTVSYRLGPLGIGAGLTIATGGVNLQRSLPVAFSDGREGSVELDGGANPGFGVNAGIYFEPIRAFSLGLTYRSRIDLTVEDGDATFEVPATAAANFQATTFSATLPLIAVTTLGVAVRPNDRLTIAADVQYNHWSAYEELRLDFNAPVAGADASVSPRNYNDAITYRLGLEYMPTNALSLRIGGYFDESPVDVGYLTPETPDIDRIGLSAGAGFSIAERLRIDASFLFITTGQRTQTIDDLEAAGTINSTIAGTFRQRAFIPGLGLSYSF